jgi:hypothetical protein
MFHTSPKKFPVRVIVSLVHLSYQLARDLGILFFNPRRSQATLNSYVSFETEILLEATKKRNSSFPLRREGFTQIGRYLHIEMPKASASKS